MMNSALESILPPLVSGETISMAMKNRKAMTCSALNSITPSGSKDSSRGYRLNSSSMAAFQGRGDVCLRQHDSIGKHVLGRGVEHVILNPDEDGADQARHRRVHGHRHAVAHQSHRRFHGNLVG